MIPSMSLSSTLTAATGLLALGWYRLYRPEHELFARARRTSESASRPWALVTGSSAGIGYGMAQALCRWGFNVIIHGRDKRRLDQATASLADASPDIGIKIMYFDTATSLGARGFTDDMLETLESFKSLEICLLINNVAIGSKQQY